jgi:pimeloyl-ACP methyl ester carboxylesterase
MRGQKIAWISIVLSVFLVQTAPVLGVIFFSNQPKASSKDDIEQLKASFREDVEHFGDSATHIKIESVEFPVQQSMKNTDTFIRKGIFIIRPQAIGTVVVCHGFTQSKNEAAFFRTLFPHFNVFAFDFRAHGELIDGQYSTIGSEEVFDVKGAVEFVKKRPENFNKPVIGFGFSMGAVSLIQAQAQFPDLFEVLILDSPFDSSTECMAKSIDKMLTFNLFGQKYQMPGRGIMMKCLYSKRLQPAMRKVFCYATGFHNAVAKTKFIPVLPINHIGRITIPCFFITCEKDKKVPVGCVRRLYDEVHSNYKRLWITHGPRHCGSCLQNPEWYTYRVNKFISDAFDKSWSVADEVYDDRIVIAPA